MKRRIALLTAILVLISALSALAQGFADMPGEDSKYYKAFEYAIARKLIAGDGTSLNPDSYITQAEALTIISRIKPFDAVETDITFYGVSKDKWYYSTVAKAYTLGYITPDFNGMLAPGQNITRISANGMIGSVYGKTPTPWSTNELCTRADFIWEIYFQAPDGYSASVSVTPTESPTEAPTEAPTEFSDLRAKAAQEAMQVALGIRSDGSSYVDVASYKDVSQTDWASGNVSTSSSSSRPSGGSSNNNNSNNNSNDDNEVETQAPTESNTGGNEDATQAPTEEPTQAPTEEPTYSDYDGPIDNDKDNVIEDPFNDGWTPPGWGNTDTDTDSGSDSDSGGWDEEDDDFFINDADDPDYEPETKPTEAPTDEPSEDETEAPTDEPSEDETDEPTDEPTGEPTEDEPTDEPTGEPTEDEPADEPTEDLTEDTDATEPEEDAGEPKEDEPDENPDEDGQEDSQAMAWLFSKDWWFN